MSLAENVEYLRRLRELNGITGFGDPRRQARPAPECPLVEVESFGSNPGRLKMFAYVPAQRQPLLPLVIVLHGCGQSAAEYDLGAGWSTLAKHFGFALLMPEQQRINNPQRCFNWFQSEDITRGQGEVASIREMIARMVADCAIDERRIFVTGLSAGGAMTMAMLSAHPDLFAGGAVIAGLPFGAARNMRDAILQMRMPPARPAGELGDLVRRASNHRGKWPKLSVWHGTADYTVHPDNAGEIVKQWLDLHHLPLAPMAANNVNGYPHEQWWNADGETMVESYTITNMAHGTPIGIAANDKRYGKAGPYLLEAGISSSYLIAKFFGVTDWIRQPKPAVTSPSTKLIPEVSPISALPALTKMLRRPDDARAAEPAEAAPEPAKPAGPRPARAKPNSSAARPPKRKAESSSATPAPGEIKALSAVPADAPAEVKPPVAKPGVAKAIDMTPADPSPVVAVKVPPIPAAPAPESKPRRVIDVAAVIDRALKAAGLK
ncbi:putative polyhydroxy-alkanoate/butyrate(PHA/PHB) depolymerase [Bradyrhizobium sp. ORS 285]|uniref:extracellular catalytic domain type 1 short-chain-length polyhydroxyalkanoate depolymerase n=1 Tax=Bradyrhizobium sp. ORS 285 TaxID=115808 RepID=UPI00024072A0|nr:PHB depolymerase family esterase [Bradyrhizobium sp. ORS 285]CCD84932.1 putative polyhydroxy-alkanoate/butyrate(PHA/PHB) depolymerase [Bradyrhizobium sp. ORS 285]SMX62302.1 putative polyhydroxy-alkanoate/butyrate(PHA/PHB) depolymerase [Bradyrhizobium sp. ORS 285]